MIHDMKRRFGLYGFGFAIGIVLVFFFLGGKNASCSWMPNDRMLKIIRSKQIIYSQRVQEKLNLAVVDTADINLILTDGNIDFSKSEVKNEPCRKYIINGEIVDGKAEIMVKICDSIATIETIELN